MSTGVPAKTCFYLAADKNYFPFACLAARRILDISRDPLPGYILHTAISDTDRSAAVSLLGDRVTLLDVSHFLDGLSARYDERITKATYIRLFADLLPEFNPYERIVYLDCDVLFNRDPAALAAAEMKLPLLAAHDMPSYYDLGYRSRLSLGDGAPYFNAGVLVMDLPAVREMGLLEKARSFVEQYPERCVQHDQDALNVAFEGKWQTLHPLWNVMTNLHWMPPFATADARHFSGQKPWRSRPTGVEKQAFEIYRALSEPTPWRDRFDRRYNPRSVSLFLKALERRLNGVLAELTGNPRSLRKSRLDRRLPEIMKTFADHADTNLPAVEYPEKVIGVG
ncbi:glycosyltransferase family 8 protein [Corticibacterium sp. UT-5YL-CI-8]|nr:glycosyltransferase family 8 protein [Tianweitania sp. UT-5YL-CI-8]